MCISEPETEQENKCDEYNGEEQVDMLHHSKNTSILTSRGGKLNVAMENEQQVRVAEYQAKKYQQEKNQWKMYVRMLRLSQC